jgi:hypothetical protein
MTFLVGEDPRMLSHFAAKRLQIIAQGLALGNFHPNTP